MYTAISLFSASFVFILFMIINKSKEVNTGSALISFHGKVDNFFNAKYVFLKKIVTEFPLHFGREALYVGVHKSMKISDSVKGHLHAKIGHIIEAVKGKHFPKSKGEASFFLGHIEKNKDNSEEISG
jgi:hypothetical protein